MTDKPTALGLGPGYVETMRSYVDKGGQLSHENGLDLLIELERFALRPASRDLTAEALKAGMNWYQPASRPDDIASTVTMIWTGIWDYFHGVVDIDSTR